MKSPSPITATSKPHCRTVSSGKAAFHKGIAIESDNIDLLGAGTIDLETEALDLGIRSEARLGQGRAVSAATSNLVRVQGTLAEPRVGIDPVGAAETAARVGGAVATLGLSLLGEAAYRGIAGGGPPCQVALGKTDGEPTSGDAGAPKADEQGSEKGVEGVIEGIGDSLKGLFGD